ncbi:MAG: hypothetical protein DHS20C15_27820 [Planctomycetota bacterium]|nr:MAG: hypothetical protein DHS20C15_27820 [Planctomycetota bacterium]
MHRFNTLALAAALSSTAFAGDFSMPSGVNLESVPGAGVTAALTDGTLLYSTGSFGADALSTRNLDGSFTLFAEGFGSLSGIAQSPVTGQIVVGDSAGAAALWLLEDLNRDGDCLDAGENIAHPVQPPMLPSGAVPLPFDIAFRPGTDEFWMSGSTPFGFEPFQGVLTRTVDGANDLMLDDLGFAAGIAFDGDTLYLGDIAPDFSSARVLRMDASGGPLAPSDYATGLPGASGVVRAADGSVYVSGLGSCVGRLSPDLDNDGSADAIETCFLDGFAFSGGLTLVEGPNGFVPGANGDGTLFVGDFSFAGARTFRSAPHAATAVAGAVAQNSKINVTVSGTPGATALYVLSLDVNGTTIAGIGDLCLGFAGMSLISPLRTLDRNGEAEFQLLFREFPGLVGEALVIQGLTLEDGRFGIGNGLDFTFDA